MKINTLIAILFLQYNIAFSQSKEKEDTDVKINRIEKHLNIQIDSLKSIYGTSIIFSPDSNLFVIDWEDDERGSASFIGGRILGYINNNKEYNMITYNYNDEDKEEGNSKNIFLSESRLFTESIYKLPSSLNKYYLFKLGGSACSSCSLGEFAILGYSGDSIKKKSFSFVNKFTEIKNDYLSIYGKMDYLILSARYYDFLNFQYDESLRTLFIRYVEDDQNSDKEFNEANNYHGDTISISYKWNEDKAVFEEFKTK